ncbi:REF/SRPP-like protein At3g05500 [Salvia miltiorrhiza]|uniref:REF/SRPP-like protein At3g05500 n=1 Tax=Salvia miltiorrhiza TaxID=226208 RepID=UPI0025AD95E5|nr:REF/SRPP-like protein At3g05500 [Salvia miltiorrhiza]XP_057778139.1 REF/SRPP-like protein At3g05500 [Salvia miltiorrhiza]
MAEADSNSLQQPLLEGSEEEQRLKYFEFVQVASLHALMYAAKLYSYAKENSGPLKTGVDTVEGTVKTVVGPVYQKYQGVPVDVLRFVDRKVDESINKVQNRVPPTLKQVSTQAFEAAQKAPAAARSVVSEVKNTGLVGSASGLAQTVYAKYEPAAKDLYTKYEPVAEQYASATWHSLNQLPLFPQVAQAVAPTATYYTNKYNEAVQQAADKGWQMASHLPLVPTEKIAKVLSSRQESTVTVE